MKQRIVVPYQLPEFVRAEYPAFVEFLKAYYQWLEEEHNIGKVSDLVDIDNTLDGFVDYFRNQLDVYGITRVDPNNRLILKNIRELYQAKGSNAGFDFLFKILFNKTSSVIEPWDYVLIPSNGNWIQETSILVKSIIGDVWELQGNSAVVRDDLGRGYQIFVKNIIARPGGIFELFINRISPQAKLTSIRSIETLDQVIEAEILSTVASAKIRKPGKGFRVGQIFNIGSYSGSGTLCKVKSVDSEGGLIAVEILRFGSGFQSNFSILLDPPESPSMYAPSRIEIQKNILEPKIFPTPDTVDAQDFSGSIVRHNYTNTNEEYMLDLTYVGQTMAEFINSGSNPNSAIIDFTVGQYCVYPGYYRDSNNIIGDLVYIQDSYYYQAFSYVTVIEESISSYKDILRDILHPSGTNHFAVQQINSTFKLNIGVEASLNVLSKEDAIRDFAVAFDAITSFVMSVVWNDSVSSTDAMEFSVQTTLTDFAIADDLVSLNPAIMLGDTDFAIADDVIDIFQGKAFYSPVETVEDLELSHTKYLEHQVSLTTSSNSGAVINPYADVAPVPYWDLEYVDSEREFTN